MPYAVTSLHPFEPAFRNFALLSGRVLVGKSALQHDGEGCDARVRVNAEQWPPCEGDFGMIQEHERLDQFADVGRADEPRDRTVLAAAGAKRDATCAGAHGVHL